MPEASDAGLNVPKVGELLLDRASAARRSDALRLGTTPSLRHRRRAATYAVACAGIMGYLSLYQLGVVRRLAELPLPGFDANTVDASAEAYQVLGVPDAALGVVSYGLTTALAGLGGERPSKAQAALLAGKALGDAAWAAKLTADQGAKHKAACSWCLVSTLMTFATLRETLAAYREA